MVVLVNTNWPRVHDKIGQLGKVVLLGTVDLLASDSVGADHVNAFAAKFLCQFNQKSHASLLPLCFIIIVTVLVPLFEYNNSSPSYSNRTQPNRTYDRDRKATQVRRNGRGRPKVVRRLRQRRAEARKNGVVGASSTFQVHPVGHAFGTVGVDHVNAFTSTSRFVNSIKKSRASAPAVLVPLFE